jgi:Domain of unknown function (DUF222)
MTQPPASGRGPGEQPGRESGARGDSPGTPGGVAGARRSARDRELRLSDFVTGGAGDTCPPGPRLAAALERVSGQDRRCVRASDEELMGVLSRWEAVESWAAAGKLGVLAEFIRRRAKPGHEQRAAAGLPDAWEEGAAHEVMPVLGLSARGADQLIDLAVTLQARLPGIYAALSGGVINAYKATVICGELAVLDDARAAQAEALILGELAGKTAWALGKLAAQAVCVVDPDGAARRRERAERDDARVRFWREHSGSCALAAYGLPTDAALAANANITRRAGQYKKAKVNPDATMDQLRVLAYLDILNGVPADKRIAAARAEQAQAEAAAADGADGAAGPGPRDRRDNRPGDDWPADDWFTDEDGSGDSDGTGSGDGPVAGDSPGDSDSPGGDDASGGPGETGAAPGAGDAGPELAASINLTIPLGTYLGQAQRPGLGHGLGPLDPKLARDLAAAAARSPHSRWCVTVTDADGIAIGHGCARPARKRKRRGKGKPAPGGGGRDGPRDGKPAFTPRDDPGPPGGYGTWTLTLPGGQELDVSLLPIPVTDCDHRYESHSYQPSDLLRHLVQIRDGQCTFPCCSRPARESDFEHAVPYDQGGRTCACNAGARSRRCHRVKQSKGWSVTQPRPGWHQWTTPSGRTCTQGPMKYPI